MAIQHHPLSNDKLGTFMDSHTVNLAEEGQHAKFVTIFYYQNGRVELNNSWQWNTFLNEEEKEVEEDNKSALSMQDINTKPDTYWNDPTLDVMDENGAFTI